MLRQVLVVLEMIKIQHTVFALPFAAVGAAYAAGGWPTWRQCLLLLGCMVGARSAAMAFNRIVDARHDAANPRTAGRAIPRGLVSIRFAWGFTAASVALFAGCAALLNGLVLALVPVALAVTFGYSLTKRFTPLCHVVLGLSLAIAPVGAWLALRPELAPFPLLLAGAVTAWVAGFDVLYACEDADFDRRAGLKSIPAALGIPGALAAAKAFHVVAVLFLAAPVAWLGLGGWYAGAVAAIVVLLAWEHALVRPDDLRRVNRAFFHVNAVVAFTLMAGALLELARTR